MRLELSLSKSCTNSTTGYVTGRNSAEITHSDETSGELAAFGNRDAPALAGNARKPCGRIAHSP